MVPEASDLDLETLNGGIEVKGVYGDIRFEAVNGGIRLSDLGGDVRGSTVNGGVVVRLAGDRWRGRSLDVDTTNGSVKLQIPEEYSADVETYGQREYRSGLPGDDPGEDRKIPALHPGGRRCARTSTDSQRWRQADAALAG